MSRASSGFVVGALATLLPAILASCAPLTPPAAHPAARYMPPPGYWKETSVEGQATRLEALRPIFSVSVTLGYGRWTWNTTTSG